MNTSGSDAAFTHRAELNHHDGLTKREFFAIMALQGILSSKAGYINQTVIESVQDAVDFADSLIEALNKQ